MKLTTPFLTQNNALIYYPNRMGLMPGWQKLYIVNTDYIAVCRNLKLKKNNNKWTVSSPPDLYVQIYITPIKTQVNHNHTYIWLIQEKFEHYDRVTRSSKMIDKATIVKHKINRKLNERSDM
jgi:hypothetical protein